MAGSKLDDVDFVIVQAGGLGTRLGTHTRNKPKCLVSVDGQPIIYALFDRFPDATFIVILDHLADVFERYVALFPPRVRVLTVRAGRQGTAAGLVTAARLLPSDEEPFLLVWGDLRIGDLPDAVIDDALCLGLTSAFPCRWSWSAEAGLTETASDRSGVMGLFGIRGRGALTGCPDEGEFVEWLAAGHVPLKPVLIDDVVEIGTVAALAAQRRKAPLSRYFNAVRVHRDTVEKRSRDASFAPLIASEIRWYKAVAALGFPHVPALLAEEPLTLARVPGRHPFELALDPAGRARIFSDIVEALGRLHAYGARPGSPALLAQMYRDKPLERLDAVRRLVPDLATRESLRVNGRRCRNILHPRHAAWFTQTIDAIGVEGFTPIHGDPTFSNTLIDADGKPWFIDPRGRFGESSLYGDPRYDWAKLYYSIVGGYDRFNARRFQLRIDGDAVDVAIDGHGWGDLRPVIEDRLGRDLAAIRVIHASIWLSLSGFVVDDYDSIIAAYALGLYHLDEATS